MTGTEDSNSSTRPISVAELLAKNGTIGAPPVGGRRRRRRGNSDAVTVAELTGEIPIIRPDDPPPAPVTAPETVAEPIEEAPAEAEVEVEAEAEVEAESEVEAEVEADTAADVEAEDTDVEDAPDVEAEAPADVEAPDVEAEAPADVVDTDVQAEATDVDVEAETVEQVAPVAPPAAEPSRSRRFGFLRLGRRSAPAAVTPVAETSVAEVPADQVDTVDDAPVAEETAEIEKTESGETAEDAIAEEPSDTITEDAHDEDLHAEDLEPAFDDEDLDDRDSDELPSYLRSSEEPLFGGQSVVDELARQGDRSSRADTVEDRDAAVETVDADETDDDLVDEPDDHDAPRTMSPLVSALWIIGQSVIAVVFGAGLFVAFDQLWKWNNIIALVLSVLVILGLVVGVRLVRKTEDIGSTLIAVAVGALVTLGPLALLQSG